MLNRRCDDLELSIGPAKRRIVVEITLLLLSVAYAAIAAAHFAAVELSTHMDPSHLLWASRLDPWNAKYQDLVGRYQMFAANRPDIAVPFFRQAVSLNPYDSRGWLDLAAAQYLLRNHEAASSALQHAASADPNTPNTAWESANLYVALNDRPKALQSFRTVLRGDPALHDHALEYCWRLNPDATSLSHETVPPEATADFLEFLIAKHESSGAAGAWARLIQLQQPIERQHVFNYLQFLIARHDFVSAKSVWSESATVAGLGQYQPSAQNMVVNGDFHFTVLNAGFDWRYQKKPGASLSLDPTQIKSGIRSLEVNFDSSGIDDAGIYQLIPVYSNTPYELSANFRSEDLRGAGGPRLVVQDFASGRTIYTSDDLRSDRIWSRTQGIFSTGPDAQLILLRIARIPAGDAIRGKLWIDSVTLRPAQTVAEARR
jgi:tetratricopeptide (TPR) repeat protein